MKSRLTLEPVELKINLPYLPPEIKSLVAEHLDKSDLKTLRYVSKEWSANATPFLFDRVYISPYDKDLQVFANITQNPTLASSIKELIVDNSSIPELPFWEYFEDLCREIRSITRQPNKIFPFYSSSRRLNQFVHEITQYRRGPREPLPEFSKAKVVVEGFQWWQQLIAQEQRNIGDAFEGVYYTTLNAGLHRLPNLQAVKVDNELWWHNLLDVGVEAPLRLDSARRPYHVLRVVYSGSPLSRSWNPWYLRPKRSTRGLENSEPGSLHLVMRALSGRSNRIKRFTCKSILDEGLPAAMFSSHRITDDFPSSMAISLCQLEFLELQITPSQYKVLSNGLANALGFLSQLLKQMTSLKRLSLNFETVACVNSRQALQIPSFHDSCIIFSQVFHRQGLWPRLRMLHLRGLAVSALDLWSLVNVQMPQLRRLWLSRIDLFEGRWEEVVESMRWSGPWELFSLQRELQHQSREWWPYRPDQEYEDWTVLREYSNYVQDGGRHPSLPPGCDEYQAVFYLWHMFHSASEGLGKAFLRRLEKRWQH